MGITTVALFAMHTNLYLILKTDGPLQQKLIEWTKRTVPLYLICFVVLNAVTILKCPHIEAALRQRPLILGVLFIASLLVTFNSRREAKKGHEGRAFICSCLSIVSLMLLFAAAVYPNMVFSTPDHANDLNIYNGSSTAKSLQFILYVAMIGVPVVLTYTATIYYVFRGKVVLTEESY